MGSSSLEDVDSRLSGIHDRLKQLIKDYLQSRDEDLGISSEQLVRDVEKLSDDLHQISEGSPQFVEINQAIEAHFSPLGPTPATGNPLSNLYEFYRNNERKNPLGLGAFFRLEFLKPKIRKETRHEERRETTHAGMTNDTVILEEIKTFQNDELVFHRVVRNGEAVLKTSEVTDFSILHGLPAQLRRDGVDEQVVLMVEEYIQLINYHILKNIEEQGGDIPEHPQLAVAEGYSPNIFVRNFVALMVGFSNP